MTKAEFLVLIQHFYDEHGRHDLAWRHAITPYRILVSEIMLQQTQVERVKEKFAAWVERWPDEHNLTDAKPSEVLVMWQGLGYNNRAKRLWEAARLVAADGWPTKRAELEALPGIGPYTSGALMAFAYDQSVVFVDTNIRRIMLHHFFKDREDVPDKEVEQKVAELLPDEWSPRKWYWALMDYGSHLGKILRAENPNRRSKSYTKQSKFAGSVREVRGAMLRALSAGPIAQRTLWSRAEKDINRSIEKSQRKAALDGLEKDGLIQKTSTKVNLT